MTSICFENFLKYFQANLKPSKDDHRRMTSLLLSVVSSVTDFTHFTVA